MSGRLPEFVEPLQLAEKRAVLEGVLEARAMGRLKEAVVGLPETVAARLEFGRDEAGRAVVAGRISATLVLECQRCLGPMELELELAPRLGVCGSEAEAARLPDQLDPLVVGDGPVSVRGLVEDELLLALPVVARHASACREIPAGDQVGSGAAAEDTRRPFGNLRDLLDGK